ncbi:MAG: MFS transporter [Candidatus Rokubacteria bacterium]|nr:MFS transporter [Candidatus Rokubacteria bacterium]
MSAPAGVLEGEARARRHLRHNVLALGADLGLYMVGLSFASPSTLLPAFAAHLGAPNVVIGAIPAVMTAGWFLPALFVAGHTETLARKLPFILRWTVWERLPLLALGLVALLLADRFPVLAQVVMLLLLFVMTGMGGLLMPAWMDVVGRTSVREPPFEAPATNAPSLGQYLGRIPRLLRHDRNLSWFLVARGCVAFAMMASGFYAVYALRTWQGPTWQVGVFTTALLVGQTVGNLTLGWLADRAGHRLVVIAGAACMVAANALALGAPSIEAFTGVFVLAGVQIAAVNVSWLPVLLEFAPAVHERPTYVGIGNTAFAPAAFAAPVLAGLMADRLGFPAVFVTAGAFGLLALLLLIARVRDPRR